MLQLIEYAGGVGVWFYLPFGDIFNTNGFGMLPFNDSQHIKLLMGEPKLLQIVIEPGAQPIGSKKYVYFGFMGF